jgi:hypothetical protein
MKILGLVFIGVLCLMFIVFKFGEGRVREPRRPFRHEDRGFWVNGIYCHSLHGAKIRHAALKKRGKKVLVETSNLDGDGFVEVNTKGWEV